MPNQTPNIPIGDRFEYQKPNDHAVEVIKEVREACKNLAMLLEEKIPECREKSLAITKLEEVSMWANKATVFHDNGSIE